MNDLREAAHKALEAIEDSGHKDDLMAAADVLRAFLAEPVQEPVAWVLALPDGRLDRLSVVAYDDEAEEMLRRSITGCALVPLYAAPPQRKPLTEEEMYAVEEEARKNFRLAQAGPRGQMITYWDSLPPWLIRAVERAHGIKE